MSEIGEAKAGLHIIDFQLAQFDDRLRIARALACIEALEKRLADQQRVIEAARWGLEHCVLEGLFAFLPLREALAALPSPASTEDGK